MKGFTRQNYDLRNTIGTVRKFLLITGFFPRKDAKFKFLRLSMKFFCLSVTYLQFLTMMIYIVVNHNDLSKVSETLQILMTQITVMTKLLTVSRNPHRLLELEDGLESPQFYGFSQECLAILRRKVGASTFGVRVFQFLSVTSVGLFCTFPFLDRRSKGLPLPGWYPYDVRDYYAQTAGFQISVLLVSAYHNCNIDCLMWMLTIVGAAQFEMLKENLKNIRYSIEENKSSGIEEELRACIKHHKTIVLFVKSIESLFSNGTFVQFFSSVIIICMSGFQMTVIPIASAQFFFLTLYFSCMMWQVGMYCWYGHDIMTTSDEIGKLFYMSNWYESEVRIRKIMIIFMEGTKKPITLMAGNLIPLSLVTLMTILRSSYSYFAVMQRLYRDE